MMHMFKNLSTVKDYNHSEVDGDARNRMKRHRKLQEDNFEASATGDDRCRHRRARDASRPIKCRASRPYAVRPINGTFGNHYFTVVLFDRADIPPVARLNGSTTATYLLVHSYVHTFGITALFDKEARNWWMEMEDSPNPPSTRCGTLVVTCPTAQSSIAVGLCQI
jgi:hypothetical protein